jgi:hypothetical protein
VLRSGGAVIDTRLTWWHFHTCIITENGKFKKKFKKMKHHRHLHQVTLLHLQLYTCIYSNNEVNECFEKNFICNPFGYACDTWCKNDLNEVKEKHASVLATEFADVDIAQSKACVTCT